jgi:hypothetical protein
MITYIFLSDYMIPKWESVLKESLNGLIDPLNKTGSIYCKVYGQLEGDAFIKMCQNKQNYTLCKGKLYYIYDTHNNTIDHITDILISNKINERLYGHLYWNKTFCYLEYESKPVLCYFIAYNDDINYDVPIDKAKVMHFLHRNELM